MVARKKNTEIITDERAQNYHNHEPTVHSPAMLAAFAGLLIC